MKILAIIALCALVSCCGESVPPKFPQGTVVQHKTGGPAFVVTWVWNDQVTCRYFNEKTGEYVEELFYESELQQVVR